MRKTLHLDVWRGSECVSEADKKVVHSYRSNHQRCSIKRFFLKFRGINRKALFHKVAGLKAWNFFEKRLKPWPIFSRPCSNIGVFLWILWNCQEHLSWMAVSIAIKEPWNWLSTYVPNKHKRPADKCWYKTK